MTHRPTKRLIVTNVLGTLGYISCLLQWLWLGVVYAPTLIDNGTIRYFILPEPTATSVPMFQVDGSSLLWTALAIGITIIVLIVTVIVLVRLPISIARAGRKAVASTTESLIPTVTHHKELSAAKKRRLSVRITKYVKFGASFLPFMLLSFVFSINSRLAPELIVLVGAVLAAGSFVWFGLEYLAAKWLKLPLEKII